MIKRKINIHLLDNDLLSPTIPIRINVIDGSQYFHRGFLGNTIYCNSDEYKSY